MPLTRGGQRYATAAVIQSAPPTSATGISFRVNPMLISNHSAISKLRLPLNLYTLASYRIPPNPEHAPSDTNANAIRIRFRRAELGREERDGYCKTFIGNRWNTRVAIGELPTQRRAFIIRR